MGEAYREVKMSEQDWGMLKLKAFLIMVGMVVTAFLLGMAFERLAG